MDHATNRAENSIAELRPAAEKKDTAREPGHREIREKTDFLDEGLTGELHAGEVSEQTGYLDEGLTEELRPAEIGKQTGYLDEGLTGELRPAEAGKQTGYLDEDLTEELRSAEAGKQTGYLDEGLTEELHPAEIGKQTGYLDEGLTEELHPEEIREQTGFSESGAAQPAAPGENVMQRENSLSRENMEMQGESSAEIRRSPLTKEEKEQEEEKAAMRLRARAEEEDRNPTGEKNGGRKRKSPDRFDFALAFGGILIAVFLIAAIGVNLQNRAVAAEKDSIAELGAELVDSDLSEETFRSVARAVEERAAQQEEQESQPEVLPEGVTEVSEEEKIPIEMKVSTIFRDLKIKFINENNAALETGIAFRVQVTDPSGQVSEYTNTDKDGIIYKDGLTGGTYRIAMLPLEETDEEAKYYSISGEEQSVTVSDQLEYKKVDVSDEIKKESEVNVAAEDTAVKDKAVAAVNKDTVEFVDSSSTVSSTSETVSSTEDDKYESVPKSEVEAPSFSTGKLEGTGKRLPALLSLIPSPKRLIPDFTATMLADVTESGQSSDASTEESDSGENEDRTGAPARITVDQSSVIMKNGDSLSLGAAVRDSEDALIDDQSIKWSSSDTSVATVSNGEITAVGEGSCTVTLTSGKDSSVKTDISVTVNAKENDSEEETDSDSTDSEDTDSEDTDSGEDEKTAPLKDKQGNRLYVRLEDGSYREAVASDYENFDTFYRKRATASSEDAQEDTSGKSYTGWQTIDGNTYYYDKNGNPVTGEQTIQGIKYTFSSEGVLTSQSKIMGIDVSGWNGSIDWNAVKSAGVQYVIIRCGYRGSSLGALIEDSKFRTNISGARAAGLKVGVYFFTQAISEVEAVEEASMVLSLVGGSSLSYPIFLDVEWSGGRADSLSVSQRTAVVQAFCRTIANSGYKAGVYANKNWLEEKLDASALSGYYIWLAEYAAAPTYSRTRYNLWQYSSAGRISGISGDVDMNVSYLGY